MSDLAVSQIRHLQLEFFLFVESVTAQLFRTLSPDFIARVLTSFLSILLVPLEEGGPRNFVQNS